MGTTASALADITGWRMMPAWDSDQRDPQASLLALSAAAPGWLQPLAIDPAQPLGAVECWAELLGAWRLPTCLLCSGADRAAGLARSHWALLRHYRVPLVGMIQWGGDWRPAERRAEGLPVRLHYAGRSRESMAFLPELQALLGDALHVHADDEQGGPLAIAEVLDACLPTDHLYVCGPQAMLDAVLDQCQKRGWAQERVHFELFATPQKKVGDQSFTVELAQSGQSWNVAADQSLLDCLIEHGCDPMFDCKRGECGVCTTTVLEGEIDHRDYYLSTAEKAKGDVMQICVSRARGARLVLDL